MKYLLLGLLLAFTTNGFSQGFTKQDSIRGSVTNERAWWDVQHYDLDVQVVIKNKWIIGSNFITYKVLESSQIMQIDLQVPMKIDIITQDDDELDFFSNGDHHFITLKKPQKKGEINIIKIYFKGNPREAKNAPWDGGFVWSKDSNGKPFIANANQSIGSSVWWPCKDHPSDEPDLGAKIRVTAPNGLDVVSNGQLKEVNKDEHGGNIWVYLF